MSGSRNEKTFFSSTVNDAFFFYKKRLRPQACFDGNRRFAAALSRRYGGFKAAGLPRHHRLGNRGNRESGRTLVLPLLAFFIGPFRGRLPGS